MRSLASSLLPLAATALVVTTVSTGTVPSDLSEAEPRGGAAGVVAGASMPVPTDPSTPRAGRPTPTSQIAGLRAGAPRLAPRGRWAWPLEPRPLVARPFVRPSSTWGAGHRGVDLAAPVGSEVRAVDAGVVGHVGVVAGRGTVTVLHRSGLRSTYEPVEAVVEQGDEVVAGQRLGSLAARGHCLPAACLHLGALRGPTYIDPLALLGATRVRLLPPG